MQEDYLYAMNKCFLLLLVLSYGKDKAFAIQECGSIVNNTLTSPGYPNSYPPSMDCNYSILIPPGMMMEINFHEFNLEFSFPECIWTDYLKVINENNKNFGVFCGQWTEKVILVTGDLVVMSFHSNVFYNQYEEKGFLLSFTAIPHVPPENLTISACESVVNNSLTSPGYPNSYPPSMDCNYSVPIPRGMAMNIQFHDFDLEIENKFPVCELRDFVRITNEKSKMFGVFCGARPRPGDEVLVTGEYVVIIFHSDYSLQRRGFHISLALIPIVAPKVLLPTSVIRAAPTFSLTIPVTGTPPIYTALIRNSIVLFNVTYTASIYLEKEENYTCVASSNYGIDVRDFSVIFTDCEPKCAVDISYGNTYSCKNLKSLMDIRECVPAITEVIILSSSNFSISSLGMFSSLATLNWLILSSNNIEPLSDEVFPALPHARTLDLSSNRISHLPDGVFSTLINLQSLSLKSNAIAFLSDGVFANLKNLKHLDLSKNAISSLPDRVLANLTSLQHLDLSSNSISFLPERYFAKLTNLETLFLPYNNITFLPDGVFGTGLHRLYLYSNAIASLPVGFGTNLTNLHTLHLSSNAIEFLPDGIFVNLKSLATLDLSSNAIALLPHGIFDSLTNLQDLTLSSNAIAFLPEGIFDNLQHLDSLALSSNPITFLPEGIFASLKNLHSLYLHSNAITSLSDGVFANLKNLRNLALSGNAISFLPDGCFANLRILRNLFFSSNSITYLPNRVFHNLENLFELNLASNAIKFLPADVFSTVKDLYNLNLSSNALTSLADGVFDNLANLRLLDLSFNAITFLPDRAFANLTALWKLFISNNKIQYLPKDFFCCTTQLLHLFASGNRLKNIPYRAFFNLYPRQSTIFEDEGIIILSDNPIQTIGAEAFRLGTLSLKVMIRNRTIKTLKYSSEDKTRCTVYLNPDISINEAIRVRNPHYSPYLISALLVTGFTRIPDKSTADYLFLPCPLGTFSNSTSRGEYGCRKCPPGGFYSDDVGYVASSCKKCPNGSYVPFNKAPGTQAQDCKTCPLGTESDFFAGLRACKCLKGFYRTHMFEKCHKCAGQGGLECKDDYATLKSGYWWKWRNESQKIRYRVFIANLLASAPALGHGDVQYPYPIPTPYKCLVEESCRGGLDSQCYNGYEGPLCGVCSSGYYKQLHACKPCPSKKWMVGQLSIVAAILLMIMVILVWINKRKSNLDEKHSLVDMVLAKLKIMIGFYQVTYGLLEAFSYIQWPNSLRVIGKYSGLLQVNILQIAPVHCLLPGFHVDAFGNLIVMMTINATVLGIYGVAYGVRKVILFRNRCLLEEERLKKLSEAKELVFRNLFFFLYVTYLSTCSKTANVLPLACRELCRDEKEKLCNKYLTTDYSIHCQGTKYNYLLIVAYISIAYIFALPVTTFITLLRKRKLTLDAADFGASEEPGSSAEVITGLRFLFENYKTQSWYWELVEMSRKVILASGLILVGQESRSYIGLALTIAGMYGLLFSYVRPMRGTFENRLMSTSLAVTVVNLAIGAVSKIPAENITDSTVSFMDTVFFHILVIGANTLVVGLLAVQYAVFLYGYFKEWRKNPHWSCSCFLAFLLPLNDLRGEIGGLVETNVLKSPLETGNVELPTLFATVKDTGVIDVSFDEGGRHDVDMKDLRADSCNAATCVKRKCNRGTQTEIQSLFPIFDGMEHDAMESTHF